VGLTATSPRKSAFKDMEVVRTLMRQHAVELPLVTAATATYERALVLGCGQQNKGG
jgi:3-hydroxyisobutyrate dehydrogenase-like beta-hydroxyacid dehydrogenase